MSNIKVKNLTDTNKRIRLTALDSAIANIDDSTGAIGKDGQEVFLCLSPVPPGENYAFLPWLMPTGIIPKPTILDFWDPDMHEGRGGSTDGYDELYWRMREPENVVNWTVHIDGELIGTTRLFTKEESDRNEEGYLEFEDLFVDKPNGVEVIYAVYAPDEGATSGDFWLDSEVTSPWIGQRLNEIRELELAQGRGETQRASGETYRYLLGILFVNHNRKPVEVTLTPSRPDIHQAQLWDMNFGYSDIAPYWSNNYVDLFDLPLMMDRWYGNANPRHDPVTGAITLTIDPTLVNHT